MPASKQVSYAIVQRIYQQVKADIQNITENEMETILNDPAKAHVIVNK